MKNSVKPNRLIKSPVFLLVVACGLIGSGYLVVLFDQATDVCAGSCAAGGLITALVLWALGGLTAVVAIGIIVARLIRKVRNS